MQCPRDHLLITGTSSGIGKATLEGALARGAHVFAGQRGPATDSEAVGDGLLTRVTLDVTSPQQIATAVDTINRHVGDRGLQGLANVAGLGVPGPLEVMPLSDLRMSFEVDVLGQVALTQPVIPLLRRARGRLVFVGSIIDRVTVPFMGALGASKSAIAAISDTWRQELAPWDIHVALVEPGFISTGADEATKARIDRLIAELDDEQRTLYGQMFEVMTERGYRVQTSGSSPDGVAEVILHALLDPRPKEHYLTGSKAHLAAFLARLPEGVQDRLKREAFGLPEPGSRRDA
ncbi:MAG: SDR family NAD(P)-dependent oxidoreductase [Candidatus Nanopelagicales bacterium]|nr:SDR family NAD(P)-dependent oxidoreductase [Candidatus Nanopelagicales bacterium]MCF8557092.1 SDR family NAD(P)-dependent oxidoreductase [Candidatus Nanopelagicales bacterium]